MKKNEYGIVSLDADKKYPKIISTHRTLKSAEKVLREEQKSGYCYLICRYELFVDTGYIFYIDDDYEFFKNEKVDNPIEFLKSSYPDLFRN